MPNTVTVISKNSAKEYSYAPQPNYLELLMISCWQCIGATTRTSAFRSFRSCTRVCAFMVHKTAHSCSLFDEHQHSVKKAVGVLDVTTRKDEGPKESLFLDER